MRRVRRPIQALVLVAPLASGCNNRLVEVPDDVGERYAAVLCAAEVACGCHKYPSMEACESDVIAAFDRLTTEVTEFDESCFEDVLAAIDDRGCVNSSDFELSCAPIVGAAKVGKTCEADHRLTPLMPSGTCKGNAFCYQGVCMKSGTTIHGVVGELGAPCDPHYTSSCGLQDLYCASDGHCATRTADGEACSFAFECDVLSFCAMETGTCTPRLGLSESCNPDDLRPCDWATTPAFDITWCNPETATCEQDDPYVCWHVGYPYLP